MTCEIGCFYLFKHEQNILHVHVLDVSAFFSYLYIRRNFLDIAAVYVRYIYHEGAEENTNFLVFSEIMTHEVTFNSTVLLL